MRGDLRVKNSCQGESVGVGKKRVEEENINQNLGCTKKAMEIYYFISLLKNII